MFKVNAWDNFIIWIFCGSWASGKIFFLCFYFLLSMNFVFFKMNTFWKLFFTSAENNGKLRNSADGTVLQCRIGWMNDKSKIVVYGLCKFHGLSTLADLATLVYSQLLACLLAHQEALLQLSDSVSWEIQGVSF